MCERCDDKQAIRDVLMRYFVGLDRRDADAFDEVFTARARMSVLDGAHTFEGKDDIIASLLTVARYPMSSHQPTSQSISVDADRGTADTFAVAHLVTDDGRVVVRGLQYLDHLERTTDGWRIQVRQHIPLWQYEAPSTALELPGR